VIVEVANKDADRKREPAEPTRGAPTLDLCCPFTENRTGGTKVYSFTWYSSLSLHATRHGKVAQTKAVISHTHATSRDGPDVAIIKLPPSRVGAAYALHKLLPRWLLPAECSICLDSLVF
jgi:hypothetical protein